jgi:hypothetical protein
MSFLPKSCLHEQRQVSKCTLQHRSIIRTTHHGFVCHQINHWETDMIHEVSDMWSVVCLALPYFSLLSHKRQDFRKMFLISNVFWFFQLILYETFFVLRRIRQYIVINLHMYSRKVPTMFVRFWSKSNFFFKIFSKNLQISYFIIILAMGAEVLRADREKDRHDETNSPFFQFCKRA